MRRIKIDEPKIDFAIDSRIFDKEVIYLFRLLSEERCILVNFTDTKVVHYIDTHAEIKDSIYRDQNGVVSLIVIPDNRLHEYEPYGESCKSRTLDEAIQNLLERIFPGYKYRRKNSSVTGSQYDWKLAVASDDPILLIEVEKSVDKIPFGMIIAELYRQGGSTYSGIEL